MRKNNLIVKTVAMLLLFCFLQMTIIPATGLAVECSYDKANPSLDSARISFKSLNYDCAEQEIMDLLQSADLTIEAKADAHVLLAAVYYAKLKNNKDKRSRVIEQFKAAFKAYRDWRGDLDISSTEFIDMMREAQSMVDKEAEQGEPAQAEEPIATETKPEAADTTSQPAVAQMPAYETQASPAKPWYKKWWAIGLGVGLIAGAVVIAGGGGSDDGGGTTSTTLPDFPDPPAGKKKH